MSLKILHTSDIHLGMKFAGYPDVQADLAEARFGTLTSLVELANVRQCDLLVVAGDLFDRISMAKKDIVRAAQILTEFQGKLTVVLPGNHDFVSAGDDTLWAYFRSKGPDVLVLDEAKTYLLKHYDLDVCLYAAPCTAKHSDKNAVGWVSGTARDQSVKFHIGIAHGSLAGVSPDFDKRYHPMTSEELLTFGLDLWLLGHTHIQYPASPGPQDRIFYAATPEPDGFDCSHEGKAWVLEIDQEQVRAESVTTGTYRVMHDDTTVSSGADIENLRSKFTLSSYAWTLMKLSLSGRLPRDVCESIPQLEKDLRSCFKYLEFSDSGVAEEITQDDINQIFTEGSFPHSLLSALTKDVDTEALQIAYDMLTEVRK
jgi:DNA repair exonuclease SbcCD nuclease subunit